MVAEPGRARRRPRAGAIVGLALCLALVLGAGAILWQGPTHLTECTVDASGDITALGAPANGQCVSPTTTAVRIGVVLLTGAALTLVATGHGITRRRAATRGLTDG